MPTIQISGPYLRGYPTILQELQRQHIALHTIRYVEVLTSEVIVILHTGDRIPLPGITLKKDVPRTHNGHIGDGKTVKHKKRIWNEDTEESSPGIRLSSRDLTWNQALSLLDWLEQERPTLEKKAQESEE